MEKNPHWNHNPVNAIIRSKRFFLNLNFVFALFKTVLSICDNMLQPIHTIEAIKVNVNLKPKLKAHSQ